MRFLPFLLLANVITLHFSHSIENGEENEEGEVFIYRYSEDSEGNPSLDNIEDDEEYEAVSDRFDELLDEAAFEEMDD